MAKKQKEKITVTCTFTDGFSERLTEALLNLYYNRKKMGLPPLTEKKKDTA